MRPFPVEMPRSTRKSETNHVGMRGFLRMVIVYHSEGYENHSGTACVPFTVHNCWILSGACHSLVSLNSASCRIPWPVLSNVADPKSCGGSKFTKNFVILLIDCRVGHKRPIERAYTFYSWFRMPALARWKFRFAWSLPVVLRFDVGGFTRPYRWFIKSCQTLRQPYNVEVHSVNRQL